MQMLLSQHFRINIEIFNAKIAGCHDVVKNLIVVSGADADASALDF